VDILKYLSIIDDLVPNDRLDTLLESPKGSVTYKDVDLYLAELFIIDEVLTSRLKINYHFYILDDASLVRLRMAALGDYCDISQGLIVADAARLIYRFTCARKFNILNKKTKQLRLNSWGRIYLSEKHVFEMYHDEIALMRDAFMGMFEDKREDYCLLCHMLLEEIDHENAKAINDINSELPVKILS